ncbi:MULTISPECIES: hypothetical protein [Hungatella]|uniref:hypothetical protein n=1 Tax=Hungatella TaxID=1649459 RepID=UPI0006C24AE0|nr:hypothetical protein [Hungatella hathewayi]CUP05405.1 Uncharacterised protein [Hungatella hathewayi]
MKLKNALRKYRALPVATGLISVAMCVPAFASDSGAVTAADWAPVITNLTAQISVSTIIAALATFMAAGIGLVFMWWGLRKAVRTIMAAFRKGKLSV